MHVIPIARAHTSARLSTGPATKPATARVPRSRVRRRVLQARGRRAYIPDQPVAAKFLPLRPPGSGRGELLCFRARFPPTLPPSRYPGGTRQAAATGANVGRLWRNGGQAFGVSAETGRRGLFPRSRHRLPQHAPDSRSQPLQLGAVLDFVGQLLGRDAWVLSPHFPNLSGQLDVRAATAAVSCLRKPSARPSALRARQQRAYRALGLFADVACA
jgi:hypothetical protein